MTEKVRTEKEMSDEGGRDDSGHVGCKIPPVATTVGGGIGLQQFDGASEDGGQQTCADE